MTFPKVTKLALGLTGVSVLSVVGVFGYKELSKKNIKEHLNNFLIKADEQKIWQDKAVKLLNANKKELDPELLTIKQLNNAKKIKDWCEEKIKGKFWSEKETLFQNIKLFCTYEIKDKINPVPVRQWENEKNRQKLKDQNDNRLSLKMKEIKAKLSTEKDALKDWCNLIYEKAFKNEQDQDYLDAKEYCQIIE